MRLSRRHLLGNLAALPVTAHASSEPITIVCPNVSDIAALDVLNAKAGGHFAAQGLDVTLVGSGSSAVAALQQLVAGRCHFLRAPAIELMKAVARQQVPLLSNRLPRARSDLRHAVGARSADSYAGDAAKQASWCHCGR